MDTRIENQLSSGATISVVLRLIELCAQLAAGVEGIIKLLIVFLKIRELRLRPRSSTPFFRLAQSQVTPASAS